MKIGRRKIYWDTTCWLAWLNDERHVWSISVMQGLEDVVFEVETNQAVLFTSTITRAEIFFGRMDLTKKNKYAQLMRRVNVQEINADPRVMDRASSIREYHHARGLSIHTPDATHLATAVLYRADEFQTTDGLQKDGSKLRKLLKLNGDVGGFNLKIVYPYPRNAPPPELVTVRGPLFLEASNDKQGSAEAVKTESAAAGVQGSSSGHPEGETTAETETKKYPKKEG